MLILSETHPNADTERETKGKPRWGGQNAKLKPKSNGDGDGAGEGANKDADGDFTRQ
jgi:hypothetical protein